jgi:hypothetical protein
MDGQTLAYLQRRQGTGEMIVGDLKENVGKCVFGRNTHSF